MCEGKGGLAYLAERFRSEDVDRKIAEDLANLSQFARVGCCDNDVLHGTN